MKPSVRALLLVILSSGLIAGLCGAAQGEEKVALRLMYPEGRTLKYKHTSSFEFNSDRAELLLLSGSGSARVVIDGEWRSLEEVRAVGPKEGEEAKEDDVGIRATIERADSRVAVGGQVLTYEQFPFTLDGLKGREFSWRVSPVKGRVSDFSPEFRPYELPRQDMVTDLWQVWAPELYPALPEGPVGEGDTWTGAQTFETYLTGATGKALVDLTSTYRVKKIQDKNGRAQVEIEEERKVRYRCWLHVELLSIILDGEGKGSGTWEIDTGLGIVVSHKGRMDIDRPEVTKLGETSPLSDIRADAKLMFKRELEKVIKE